MDPTRGSEWGRMDPTRNGEGQLSGGVEVEGRLVFGDSPSADGGPVQPAEIQGMERCPSTVGPGRPDGEEPAQDDQTGGDPERERSRRMSAARRSLVTSAIPARLVRP